MTTKETKNPKTIEAVHTHTHTHNTFMEMYGIFLCKGGIRLLDRA